MYTYVGRMAWLRKWAYLYVPLNLLPCGRVRATGSARATLPRAPGDRIPPKESSICGEKKGFSISDIETVRDGHQSEVLESIADEFQPELCFTIVFHGRRRNLDLIANTPEEAQCWIQGLERLIETVKNMDQKELLDQYPFTRSGRAVCLFRWVWIWDWFKKADKNNDGRMNFKEVQDLLKMMNVDMSEHHAYRLFQTSSLMQIYFCFVAKKLHALSIDGFLIYLLSPEGSIFNVSHTLLYQDMTQPLCRYFISSSHNTYLMEDQLRGQSSVEGYIRALKRGCRCVEVDTWDGPNGEPIVYHGHTFTSKILFRDVVSVINKYAFRASKFPVILSLENHCSVEQQDTMAQHLKSILGEQLVTCTLDGRIPTHLPSPEELCGKILLKGKKIGSLEDCLGEQREGSYIGDISDEEDSGGTEEENSRNEDKRALKACSELTIARYYHKSKERLSQALSDCIIYCKSVQFENFKHSKTFYKLYEMSSFTEYKARKLVREPGNEFVRHNAWQLTRIYPTGLRTDSSNYNPQEMWNVGCQMVHKNRIGSLTVNVRYTVQ
ncbi:hypothetical protein AB205_0047720 [Aquarana catesbeiana]|uniref:Phosphoinositide phospholipase C n=1 Tax=Aquarana catesbeiana TaxID=8400 RepID=A0A2G9RSG2_AQUCT|nr:hypothetical protein AB205_0047720 [Aquarana catesbeiana]